VRSALSSVQGVESVEIGTLNKESKSAPVTVKGTAQPDALIAALEAAKYSAKVE
jgi:hypothetical protein